MRKGLAPELGKRKKFNATVGRLGRRVNYKGYSEETILLKTIVDVETGKVVTDHVWFAYTQGFADAALAVGDTLEFEARVKEYRKGYLNKRYNIDHSSSDFKLSHPTRIRKISK